MNKMSDSMFVRFVDSTTHEAYYHCFATNATTWDEPQAGWRDPTKAELEGRLHEADNQEAAGADDAAVAWAQAYSAALMTASAPPLLTAPEPHSQAQVDRSDPPTTNTKTTVAAVASGPVFFPSRTWSGVREGYEFKTGAQGTGYYLRLPGGKGIGADVRTGGGISSAAAAARAAFAAATAS